MSACSTSTAGASVVEGGGCCWATANSRGAARWHVSFVSAQHPGQLHRAQHLWLGARRTSRRRAGNPISNSSVVGHEHRVAGELSKNIGQDGADRRGITHHRRSDTGEPAMIWGGNAVLWVYLCEGAHEKRTKTAVPLVVTVWSC